MAHQYQQWHKHPNGAFFISFVVTTLFCIIVKPNPYIMKMIDLGVRIQDRLPNNSSLPLIQTIIEHRLIYSYSVPDPPKPGWVNFNVGLNITQFDSQTYNKLFDCDFIYTVMINNACRIPDRQTIVDLVKTGIDLDTSVFFSYTQGNPLQDYVVNYPGPMYLNSWLNDAERDYDGFVGV